MPGAPPTKSWLPGAYGSCTQRFTEPLEHQAAQASRTPPCPHARTPAAVFPFVLHALGHKYTAETCKWRFFFTPGSRSREGDANMSV